MMENGRQSCSMDDSVSTLDKTANKHPCPAVSRAARLSPSGHLTWQQQAAPPARQTLDGSSAVVRENIYLHESDTGRDTKVIHEARLASPHAYC